MSKLMIQRGAVRIERKALMDIEVPQGTDTWKPIKHYDLICELEATLTEFKIEIRKEELAVAREGNFFFATLDLSMKSEHREFTSSMGIRASNNKRIGIQLAVGARVLVCDNLAFSGDLIALRRKHSGRLNIKDEFKRSVEIFSEKFQNFSREIRLQKEARISDLEAKGLIFDIFTEKKFMPIRLIQEVAEQWVNPAFPEFKDRTVWSLNNAFTYAAKEMPYDRKFTALRQLGDIFSGMVAERK